jgi:septum site-determining protein MinD
MKNIYKVAVVSGKGGVGKTTTTLNLGLAFYKLGVNVLLLDANITTPNLGLYMGILKSDYTLNDVLKGKIHITNSITQHNSGLNYIPSDLAVDGIKDLDFNKIKHVVNDLNPHADILLIDTAATLGNETLNILELADEAILVTNPDKGALADALKTIETAKRLKTPIVGVVVNKVTKKVNKKEIEKFLGVPILGMIKHDKKLSKSTESGKLYLETYKTNNTKRYYDVASKFLGNSFIKKAKKEQKNSLFNYMLKHLGLTKGEK